MIQKNKGFTLMELMAVIVILAIIILIATGSVNAILKKAREGTADEMRNNLKEAALTYFLNNQPRLKKCGSAEIDAILSGNPYISSTCARTVTISTLKSDGIFEDNKGYCNGNDNVIVYRTSDGYEAYVSDTVCKNY